MGLDQYAYARPPRKKLNDQDECITEWRKHNRLQGYMEQLWHAKGCPGADESNPHDFNCVELQLTKDDLDMLEHAIEERSFPVADGFFWGPDSYTWDEHAHAQDQTRDNYYYLAHDKQFVRDARDMIDLGWRVFYSSWY